MSLATTLVSMFRVCTMEAIRPYWESSVRALPLSEATLEIILWILALAIVYFLLRPVGRWLKRPHNPHLPHWARNGIHRLDKRTHLR